MKKSFLKKLAFVMAFATVSTSLAPAAGVLAASTPSLNAKSKTLLLNDEDRTEYDFNVANKVKGSTYKWTTSNKKVATVDAKTGLVEAQTIGTVKITCKITLPTKKTKTLTATVTVKENIDTLTIDNPAKEAIAVGDSYNFNYDYTTVTGGKTTDKVKFEVTKGADKASIKSNGVFTATEAGEYEVVALAFQSEAKYKEYLAGKTDVVTAKSAPVTVKVVNKITEAKAVKSNTLSVKFASAVTEVKASDVVVTDVKTSVKQYVKAVTVSADKKSIEIELYNALTSGNTYALVANVDKTEMKAEINFVKGAVAKIEASSQVVKAYNASTNPYGSKIAYKVFDANGLDITADTAVSYESSIAFDADGRINLANGVIAYVYIVYTDYTTGTQVRSNQIVVTGSDAVANAMNIYTIVDSASDINWNSTNSTVPMYSSKTMFVQITDQYGVKKNAVNGTDVKFVSLDPSILVIDEVTGLITPIATGTGYVKIVSGELNKVVPVTVQAASYAASISAPGSAQGSMTGAAAGLNNPGFEVAIKDQYGNNIGPNNVTFTLSSGSTNVLAEFATANAEVTYNRGTWSTWYSFTPVNPGTVYLKVSCGSLPVKYVAITVTANDTVQTGHTLSGVKELNIDKHYVPTASGDATTTVEVYTKNKNNERIAAVTGSDVSIKIVKPNGWETKTVTGGSFDLDVTDAFINHTTGTYTVTAFKNGVALATTTFKVVDTATAPSVTLASNTIYDGTASVANITALLNVPAGYTVSDIKYVSSNTAELSSKAFGTPAADTFGKATLYSIEVRITQTATGRVYTVAIPTATGITVTY
ncbi:MAG: Ig domain protein group 2 domain protein [Anaerocolumna sp.]|jgi:hypothetical protein|nr:Ig domain protein group 2 domain protein [Anaerocolumna sp.]